MRKFLKGRVSPSMAVALIAVFVALGGPGYAATGGNFILGQLNDATTPTRLTAPVSTNALQVTNTNATAGSAPLSLVAAANHAPLKVNTGVKVANLNVDRLDSLDSTSFLRIGMLQTDTVNTGVLDVANSGNGNGVQGKTGSFTASGVYGENTGGGGFGVAGRAGSSGHAIYGDNRGSGFAGYFEQKVHIGGQLDCINCVDGADVTGKVGDADKLDGIDSNAFGRTIGQAAAVNPGVNLFLGPPMAGFLRLSYQCGPPVTSNGLFYIYNDSGSVANVFVESGGANPSYTQMTAGQELVFPASASGDSFHIQAQGALGVLTIEAASVHRASDCHAQAQGVLAPA